MAYAGLFRKARWSRILAGCVVVAALASGITAADPGAAQGAAIADPGETAAGPADRGWLWPAAPFRVERGYEAPAHRYASGHRGLDLVPIDDEDAVRAPADGAVAFVGLVAGRGVLTIDHGDGLVTTLEPVDSSLAPGEAVGRGDVVGSIALGGHTEAGAFHFGVRWNGDYINPLLLLGTVPRAVLLPCC